MAFDRNGREHADDPDGINVHYVLFFIKLARRSVHIAGITTNPNDAFMLQVARNLTDLLIYRSVRLEPDRQPSLPFEPAFIFVRHPRARRYVIRVADDATVRVTIPRWGSRRELRPSRTGSEPG